MHHQGILTNPRSAFDYTVATRTCIRRISGVFSAQTYVNKPQRHLPKSLA